MITISVKMGSCFLCILTGDALQPRSENSHFNFCAYKDKYIFRANQFINSENVFLSNK